ncbi:hypothetical protein Poli38472_005852 [Pythium oligandrum]|uniref:Guanylate cyclase domain-containing protein n=1 Tax=Pythium oligandrum TaxID=41045 RepID=A0A8K1FPH8_PYTOL|nr:hypothetical protein Poli38472_005852 [Pythium oligandrum]|eukprot:TMW68384.1 hypothetical protein Poli38472_005852 [Pythium oligandrum]
MIYSELGAITCGLSVIATATIALKLRRNWVLHISTVRWLFFMFFVYFMAWALARFVFFVWVLATPRDSISDPSIHKPFSVEEIDRLGIHAIPFSLYAHNPWIAVCVIIGDVLLLGIALWLIPLTYELSCIAIKSMDRGPEKEGERIRFYNYLIHGLILAFAVIEASFAIWDGGYTMAPHSWLLLIYGVQVCGLLYMLGSLIHLKIKGRKYEAMHGTFLPSPVYQRLQRTMVVYALFATPFQISSVVLCTTHNRAPALLHFIGTGMVIYNCTGIVLSIVTGCSQSCILQTCTSCMPEDLEAQFMQRRFLDNEPEKEPTGPPSKDQVFVHTDIESSSALWAKAPPGVMDAATDLHDLILRSSLLRHRGYEITTCGDSFQLAFHSIEDAVAYCLDVQLQLLVAPWPRELRGLVAATTKQRSGHRLIFNGLRVRMGIHDSVESEGHLVCSRHAITGKMSYTGASEIIASELGEIGFGGQILVTQRVAQWLEENASSVKIEFSIEYLGSITISNLGLDVEVHELTPAVLAGRKKIWRTRHNSALSTITLRHSEAQREQSCYRHGASFDQTVL